MLPATTPRAALPPHQTIPAAPNSSFAANFNRARRQFAPLLRVTRALPMEEIEEKQKCQPNLLLDTVLEQCLILILTAFESIASQFRI
jgi:hypothetical protein